MKEVDIERVEDGNRDMDNDVRDWWQDRQRLRLAAMREEEDNLRERERERFVLEEKGLIKKIKTFF